jgi:hypothetical protein
LGERYLKLKIALLVLILMLSNLTWIFSVPMNVEGNPRYPIDDFGGGVSSGLPSTGYYDCIGVGNVDGDSYMDFVCGADDSDSGATTQGLYYYFGDGAGTWTETTITATNSWAGVEIADCDNDGNLEVWAGRQESSGGVFGWEWNGTGFSTTGMTQPYTANGANYINIQNITGGPGLDMVVASHYGIRYYEGSGTSPLSWTERSTGLTGTNQFTQSTVADFNKDGRIDIVAGIYGNGLKFYTQDSGGTSWTDRSSSLPPVENSGRVMGVTAGDVNKDGNMDVVYCRMTSPLGLFLLLGNGGGSNGSDFQWTYLNNSWVTRPSGRFYQMRLDDVDLDGDLDLLAPK